MKSDDESLRIFGWDQSWDRHFRGCVGEGLEPGRIFLENKGLYRIYTATGELTTGAIWLKVNEETRQTGDLDQMIWKVPEMISYLSGLFELKPGDVIVSGTPSGVGAVKKGDVLHGHVDGVGDLQLKVV